MEQRTDTAVKRLYPEASVQSSNTVDSFPLDVCIHLVGAVWWKGLSPTVSSAQLQQLHPPNIPSAQQPPTQDLRSQVS